MLRGETLDAVSSSIGVTAGTLAGPRDYVLAGGESSFRSRSANERDRAIQRLRAKIGEIAMANEVLLERCHRMEDEKRFLWPRRRRWAKPSPPRRRSRAGSLTFVAGGELLARRPTLCVTFGRLRLLSRNASLRHLSPMRSSWGGFALSSLTHWVGEGHR